MSKKTTAAMSRAEFAGKVDPSDEVRHLRSEVHKLEAQIEKGRRDSGAFSEAMSAVLDAIPAAEPPAIRYEKDPDKNKPRVVMVPHATDWHIGATTLPEYCEEFGSFNFSLAVDRVQTWAEKLIDKVRVMRSAYTVDECVVLGTADWTCFPPEAPITMKTGEIKPIEQISVGDEVLSTDGFGEVTAVHPRASNESDKMLTVRSVKALPITATDEHRVAVLPREVVETGWNPGGKKGRAFVVRDKTSINPSAIQFEKLGNVRVGDYLLSQAWRPTTGNASINIEEVIGEHLLEQSGGVVLQSDNGIKTSVECGKELAITNDLLWLLGIYAAEGSTQASHKDGPKTMVAFTLHIKETEHEARIRECLSNLFGVEPNTKEKPEKNVRVIQVHNKILALLFDSLCPGTATTKRLSPAIWEAPMSLLPLVSAWLDGDGCWGAKRQSGYNFICGKTSSQSLARQIATICYSEGLAVGISMQTRGLLNPSYKISFSGADAQQIAAGSLKYDPMLLHPAYEDGLWLENWYAHRVTSIHSAEVPKMLYDFTVGPNHAYNAFGLVVHNSGDIHEELVRTNEFPCPVQAVRAGFLLGEFLVTLAEHFSSVRAEILTAGNHDRVTRKPQSEMGAFNSWGFVTTSIAQQYVRDVGNITYNQHLGAKSVVDVNGTKYLIMHGDGIPAHMGVPHFGMDRLVMREFLARAKMLPERQFDSVVCGHWHVANNLMFCRYGGSLSGTTAHDHKYARHSPPHQTSWFVHEKHGELDWTRWWL
jgi:hypothetical protein